jgi:hypothetical protein
MIFGYKIYLYLPVGGKIKMEIPGYGGKWRFSLAHIRHSLIIANEATRPLKGSLGYRVGNAF